MHFQIHGAKFNTNCIHLKILYSNSYIFNLLQVVSTWPLARIYLQIVNAVPAPKMVKEDEFTWKSNYPHKIIPNKYFLAYVSSRKPEILTAQLAQFAWYLRQAQFITTCKLTWTATTPWNISTYCQHTDFSLESVLVGITSLVF